MRRSHFVAAIVFLVVAWVCVWEAANDRAELELREARNRALREEIEANRRFLERKAFLEQQKTDFDEVAPAHARILPSREVATDEQLLREFQAMGERSGVKILSVTMEVKR